MPLRRIPLLALALLAVLSCDDPAAPRERSPIESPGAGLSRVVGDVVVTDLGSLEPGAYAQAYDVSEAGHVVGEAGVTVMSDDPFKPRTEILAHPFLWSEGAGMRNLLEGSTESVWGRAMGVNAGGEVVGHLWARRFTDPSVERAFYWSDETGMVTIMPPNPEWVGWTYAEAIGDDGTVVGEVHLGGTGYQAFRWTRSGGMTVLASYPGARDNFVAGINANGDVVGWAYMMDDTQRPVIWRRDGTVMHLARKDGSIVGAAARSVARGHAINARGQVVGSIYDGTAWRAFLWSPDGTLLDLEAPAGQTFVEARDIDERGNVVGFSQGIGSSMALLWTPEGEVRSLPTLGGSHASAAALNEDGAVVGWASDPSGHTGAVRWGVPFAHEPIPPDPERVGQLSVRGRHSCILREDGRLGCWGTNDQGQSLVPAGTYTQVSAGYVHTCALNPVSEAVCWGARGGYGPMARPPAGTFAQLASGGNLSCGLRPNGIAECWGSNVYGMLSPPQIPFTSMSAGGNSACGITSARSIVCWGLNDNGSTSPPPGYQFTKVSVGNNHACGLTTTREIRCWGNNFSGETAPAAGPFIDLAAGTAFTCGILENGGISCWGRGSEGQTAAPAGSYVSLSAGWSHACAIDVAGALACWGTDEYGQAPRRGANRPPFVVLSPVTAGPEGLPLLLDASGTIDPNGDGVEISWDFGDGTTGSGTTVTHAYENEAFYTAVATARDAAGAVSRSSIVVSVTNAPPAPNVTIASPSVSLGQPASLQFEVGDPGGLADAPWQYQLDWGAPSGDGSPQVVTGTASSLEPIAASFVYAAAGTYTVTVTVRDVVGAAGTAVRSIEVTGTPGTTPPGSGVSVTPVDPTSNTTPVTLQFGSVTGGGETSVVTSPQGPPPASGFRLGNPPVYYEVTTTATFSGPITLCITYDGDAFRNEQNLRLLHGDGGGGWTDVTTSHDLDANIICGQTTSLSPFLVAEANQPPVAVLGGPYAAREGEGVTLDASASTDPDGDAVTYRFDFGDGSPVLETPDATPTHTYVDDGSYVVTAEAIDRDGAVSAPVSASVMVQNLAPSVGPVSGPSSPQAVGTAVEVKSNVTDPGGADTHTAHVEWGDGSLTSHAVRGGVVSASHVYAEAGVHTVRLRVVDDDGGTSATSLLQYVVTYDPGAGFVTGGGWISSPAGAYAADRSLTGKGTFGFVARYRRGATTPSGNTEFHFSAGALRFASSSYDWLVVAGSKAMFKGEGTIAGDDATYGFLLTAIDGGTSAAVDRFRIKIWRLSDGRVVYDNQAGAADDADAATTLGGGSIVIHPN